MSVGCVGPGGGVSVLSRDGHVTPTSVPVIGWRACDVTLANEHAPYMRVTSR